MKKKFILIMAALTILTFGAATYSHAFVGLTTVTLICATVFAGVVGVDMAIDSTQEDESQDATSNSKSEVQPLEKIDDLSLET